MSLTVKVARARATGRAMPGVGDPGFFGTIGGIIGKVAGVAKALPGPIGWAGAAVSKLMPTSASRAPTPSFPMQAPMTFAPQQLPQIPAPGPVAWGQRMIPGGQTGMMDAPPQTNGKIGAPSGYHVNESDYFLKDGTFVPAGSRWVKNRKRNPLNPQAASKAIGRIESLKRATARFSRITIRKKCCKK